MRIGAVVLATDQGLGVLARDFYRAGIVTDVVIVKHSSRPNHPEWYPGAPVCDRGELYAAGRDLIDRVDAMIFFETPFEWKLIPYCKAKRHEPRACLMPMYECMPVHLPYIPDLFLCPSELDLQYYPNGKRDDRTKAVYRSVHIPVPLPDGISWRRRKEALTFVHNAGNGGLRGRNGTKELIEAWRFVKSGAHLIVRAQKGVLDGVNIPPNVDLRIGTFAYESLFEEGDVFIFPEKFNGLSLPLQEAYAAGMLVMATRRFPMNNWLPTAPLIPVSGYTRAKVANSTLEYEEAVVCPAKIAEWVDDWYGRDIGKYSDSGREWAKTMSWEVLRPRYMEAITS